MLRKLFLKLLQNIFHPFFYYSENVTIILTIFWRKYKNASSHTGMFRCSHTAPANTDTHQHGANRPYSVVVVGSVCVSVSVSVCVCVRVWLSACVSNVHGDPCERCVWFALVKPCLMSSSDATRLSVYSTAALQRQELDKASILPSSEPHSASMSLSLSFALSLWSFFFYLHLPSLWTR